MGTITLFDFHMKKLLCLLTTAHYFLVFGESFVFCRSCFVVQQSVATLTPSPTSAMATNESTESKDHFRVLGVCGGIGSGKSQACKLLLSELGCLDHLGM
jgi:polynucleotide 5'-kinase involved in rRNA processing